MDILFEDNEHDGEKWTNFREKSLNLVKECCSVETLKSFFPIIKWVPRYRLSYIFNDIMAGLTVALLVIPQGLADATVAGLRPQYGLYSAFMGSFLYIILGTNKNVTVGVTAIMSLMIRTPIASNTDLAVLTTFISGCILLVLSIFKLGFVARFISMPVVTAFLLASALSIIAAQINNVFGIKPTSGNFLHDLINFFSKLEATKWRDAVLGICTYILLLLMRKLKDVRWKFQIITKYLSFASNAFAIIVGILLSYFLRDGHWLPFSVTGKIASGLPKFKAPNFSTTLNGHYLNFAGMCSHLGALLITIPLISLFECIVTLKSFSKGETVNASQDLLTVSLSNILGSFVGSVPVTSAFLRTAVSHATGVRSQLSGLITGTIILLTLGFLTKFFYYIPKATLAAVNIAAMTPIVLVNIKVVIDIYRAKKIDMLSFLITMIASLFWNIQYGILLGVLIDIIFVLWRTARPSLELKREKINGIGVLLININSNHLDYAAAEYLNERVIKFITTQGEFIQKVIINGWQIKNIDTTIAKSLLSLKSDLKVLKCELICWNWNKKAAGVVCRLKRSARNMFKMANDWEEFILQPYIETVRSSGESMII